MAITTAMANRFPKDCMDGIHQPGHTYKAALIKTGHAGTFGAATSAYTDLGADEVANGSGYTTGGVVLSNRTCTQNGAYAELDFGNVSIPASTYSADGVLVYNDTAAGKPVLGVMSFGGAKSASGGSFDMTIPGTGTYLLRLGANV